MRYRGWMRATVVVVVAMLVLAGCSKPTQQSSGGQGASSEAQPVTVRMVYWPGPESDAMQKVIDAYNNGPGKTDGVKVEMVLFSREGFWEKQESILSAKSPEVDLIFTASYVVGRHAPNLDPLTTVVGDQLGTFIKSSVDSLAVDGKAYGVPLDVSNHFLYYRKDLVDKLLADSNWQATYKLLAKQYLGKEVAPKPVDQWTWDDFLATSLFFTKKYNPGSATQYGTAMQMKNLIYNVMIWDDVLWSFGGHWLKEDGSPDMDNAATRQALKVYADTTRLGVTPPGSSSYEYGEANEAFKTGKAALILQWSAAYHELTDPQKSTVSDKVGIAPIPGERHATHVHALGVGLNAYSKNKEAAAKWLKYLATNQAMQAYAEAGAIPPVTSVLNGLSNIRPEFSAIAEHVDKYGFVESTSPNVQPMLEIMAKRFSAVWAGQGSADDAAKQVQAELTDVLKK